ncbi:TVP38/TMEM64 family protein [Kistimonas scapharcae]|uniref:TVP38/TMEM64 family membrane protein n=1 Tax=Kistimonas scapharcae TaxID=1036133 RepID=A0ABP8V5N7_9GAMM
MNKKRVGLIAIVVVAIALFYGFDLQQYLSRDFFLQLYQDNPLLTMGIFFLTYVAVTGLSLPGAVLMTLIGGAIFGFWVGLLVISFASTIGATLAFLFSRVLLQESVQKKFGGYLKTVNEGVEKDGAFYLFTLRLIPAIPFFIINLVMGLTPIRAWTFYWVSQVGMLAGTMVYVNAGAQLGQVKELSVSGILTPGLIASFVLLAAFPWVVRKVMARVKERRAHKGGSQTASHE